MRILTFSGAHAKRHVQGTSLVTRFLKLSQAGGITVIATTWPVPDKLFPGSKGDVAIMITNDRPVSEEITGFSLPSDVTDATGYSHADLINAITGCTSHSSGVIWSGSSVERVHFLSKPLAVGSHAALRVDLANAAYMESWSPMACQHAYLVLPAMTGVIAHPVSTPVTPSPVTDSWSN